MITVNDIRRYFDEKGWTYEDADSALMIRNSSLGDEKIPAVAFVDVNEQDFIVQIVTAETLALVLNETMLKTIYDLNEQFRYFSIGLAETDSRYRISLTYQVPVQYISDAEISAEMLIRGLQIIDDVYAEIMRAKWAR